MKRPLLLLMSTFLLLMSTSIRTQAQDKVTVKTFKELLTDLSARTSRRYDMNDVSCALIKIQYPKPGATYEGTIVGDVEYRNGEYWVYVSKGTKRIKLHLPGVPTINLEFSDYGINQTESDMTYSLDFKYPNKFKASFYIEAGFQAGSTMGPEIAIGTYLAGFNIEAYALIPMGGSDDIWWQDDNQYPAEYTYKPSLSFGGRLGYGIKLGKKIRLTPQAGIRYMSLKETAVGSDLDTPPAKGANSAALTIGLKAQWLLGRHFGISLEPEYAAAVMQSKGYKALTDVSNKIKGWNNGIGAKLAINVEF